MDNKIVTQKEFDFIKSVIKLTSKEKFNDAHLQEYTLYVVKESLLKEKFLETFKIKIDCQESPDNQFKLKKEEKVVFDKLNCINSIWGSYLYSVASSRVDLKSLKQDEFMSVMNDENTNAIRKANEMFLAEVNE